MSEKSVVLDDAYKKTAGVFNNGMNNKQVVGYYDEWSESYEKDLKENIYRAPAIMADLCNIFVKDKNSEILDIGAGTGLGGHYLKKHGFNCVDALEPSESMILHARSKAIYRNFFIEGIYAEKNTSLNENAYDVCISSGAFGEGHIPSSGINEFVRLTKKNGYIIIVMRKEFLYTVKDYENQLEPLMIKMENENIWTKITRFDIENYFYDKTGHAFVFKKN